MFSPKTELRDTLQTLMKQGTQWNIDALIAQPFRTALRYHLGSVPGSMAKCKISTTFPSPHVSPPRKWRELYPDLTFPKRTPGAPTKKRSAAIFEDYSPFFIMVPKAGLEPARA